MRTTHIIMLVTAALILGGGTVAFVWSRLVPQYADLCDLARSPGQYDGQLLAVHARVVGEDHHGYALSSPDCRQGVSLDHIGGQRDVQYDLWKDSRTSGGFPHPLVEAVFIGRLKYSRGKERCCTLVVREIRDLYSGPAPSGLTPNAVVFRAPPTLPMGEPVERAVKITCEVLRDGSLDMCFPDRPVVDDSIWAIIRTTAKPVRLSPHAKDRSTTAGRTFEFSLPPAGLSAR